MYRESEIALQPQLGPLDVEARIDYLRTLKGGWLDGGGVALPSQGLDWLSRSLKEHLPDDLPLPYMYPTELGGVRLEFVFPDREASLEIDLTTKSAYLFAVLKPFDVGESFESDLTLDESGWTEAIEAIRNAPAKAST